MPEQSNSYSDYYNQAMRRGYGSNSDPNAQGDNGYGGANTQQSTDNAATQSLGTSSGGSGSAFGSSFSNAAGSWGTSPSTSVPSRGRSVTPGAQQPSSSTPPQIGTVPPSANRPLPPRYGPDGKPLPFMGDPGYYLGTPDPNAPNNPWMPPSGAGAPSMPPMAAPPQYGGGYAPPGNNAPNEPTIYPSWDHHTIQPVGGGAPSQPPSWTDPNAPMREQAYSSALPPAGAPPPSQFGGAAGPNDNAANDPTWYPSKSHVVVPVLGGGPSQPSTAPADPNVPQHEMAYSAGGGPIDKTPAGGPIPAGFDPTRDGGPSGATPAATTPDQAAPGGHHASITDPNTPTPPPAATTPGRRPGVTPGAPLPNPVDPTQTTSADPPQIGTVPGGGGPGAQEVPNPPPPTAPVMPSLAGQQNGQPLPPGATGENASDKAMRWKQALIAQGDPDGLSQYITPFAIDFYEKNNPQQLDPVSWFKNAANLASLVKATGGAPPSIGTPVAGNTGSANGPYNPNNPFNNPNNPGWVAGQKPTTTSGPSSTPPPGLVDDSKLGPPPGLPPEGSTPPPGLPNETGLGPSPGLQQQLNGQPGSTPPPDNNSAMQNASSYLRSLLNPQFAAEQRDLSRNINAQAALTGDTQSGGLGEVSARAQGDLISKEGSRVTDYLTQATEADKSRQLQQQIATMQNTTANKQIDTNLAIAQLNDSTTKLGIKTNDDLQRYLNSKNNELQKYGIDAQSVWERYRTEAAQAGANAQAGAAYSAALLNSATSKEIASMNNATQAKANQQQYDLGVLGINATNYRADQANLIAYLQSLLGAAPPQTAPPPSGFVPYGP